MILAFIPPAASWAHATDDVSAQAKAVPLPRPSDGNGTVRIEGELKQWHKVTLTLDGPYARERDEHLNPFTDCRMTVVFTHASGSPQYSVPGYFAADGDAANSSADAGTKWRAHLSPDKAGRWDYRISFVRGKGAAVGESPGQPWAPFDGQKGSFQVGPTDKSGRDLRAQGRLQYVGQHYLKFAASGRYFLKVGPDAPENLLAYADFDGTWSRKKAGRGPRPGEAVPAGLHRYEPHLIDWRPGDPTWKNGRGKGLIGALNYLASKGCTSFSFLPYNVGGDGDDVWPFVAPEDKLHYDCSKLDQWQIVFDHAQPLGLYLHFKLQETENDDNRFGNNIQKSVPAALDGGDLGAERKLYCREIIARFAHELALNWNLGEENTQSAEQQRAMAQYLHDTDPYHHPIVVHTYPDWQDRVYPALLGNQSALTGASLQNSWSQAHQRVLKWVQASERAGRPWVVANDEQNPPDMGVPPDPGYQGQDGRAQEGGRSYTLDDIRKYCLWGTLMAGGAGVEYYFGYKFPQNDLGCEDWRSRDRSWDYGRIALQFFQEHEIPFWEMTNVDELVGNSRHDNSRYGFAKPGRIYLVYLPQGGTADLDLAEAKGTFQLKWFNPRLGGALAEGTVRHVVGGSKVPLGQPPADPHEDWLVVVRK
jgi:Domain of unknown function (DUF5060)/Putative collagen-binding domain of a collagenase